MSGGRRLTDRIHVHALGPNVPAFSYDAFDEDADPRDLWNTEPDERRRRIAERAAKGARATRRQQFGKRA